MKVWIFLGGGTNFKGAILFQGHILITIFFIWTLSSYEVESLLREVKSIIDLTTNQSIMEKLIIISDYLLSTRKMVKQSRNDETLPNLT
jgi:hypothetical protein